MSDTAHLSPQQAQFQRAYNHYIGNPPAPLKVKPNQPDDNLIISLARLIVDKGAAFLFSQPVVNQIEGDGAEQKQDWLDECWRRNKRGIRLLTLATNGGIYGHAFLRILDREPFPRLIVLDPQTVEVLTDPDDVEDVWRFTITPPKVVVDPDQKPLQRRTVIESPSGQAGYRVETEQEKWFIVDQEFQGEAWVTTVTQDWPYPFCPIAHCQNLPRPNDFWGEADLPEDVLKVLDGINRLASNMNKIIRLHAHPKIWTRGMGKRNLNIGIDSVLHLPSETAELKALEMQSDLSSALSFLNKLLDLNSMMARIPLVAMGVPDNLGAISGVALQIRYQPLLEKNEAKRLTYGDMLVELDRRLLQMSAFTGDSDVLTQLHWPEVLPSDPLMERQVWVLDESLGLVSKETLAEKAGYDYETEKKLREEEAQEAEPPPVAGGPQPPTDPNMVPPPAPWGGPGTTVNPDIAKKAKSG